MVRMLRAVMPRPRNGLQLTLMHTHKLLLAQPRYNYLKVNPAPLQPPVMPHIRMLGANSSVSHYQLVILKQLQLRLLM